MGITLKIRPYWVLLHRYTGLAITVFLIVVFLTASLRAFLLELEAQSTREASPRQQGITVNKPIDTQLPLTAS